MAFALRLGLVQLATIGIARGSRVASRDLLLEASSGEGRKEQSGANQSSLAELGPEPDIPDADVDFAFMTNNFRYPGHKESWFSGGERTVDDDVKEELVQGHICQEKGDREQTYYATSMCYWLPEIKMQDGQRQDGQRQQPLLQWKGGRYEKGKSLCEGLKGSGVCAKCSVCHNNARDESGAVRHVSFVERLELPDGCLGEKEIESICVRQFEEGSPDLKAEHARCYQLEEQFNSATAELTQCNSALYLLPAKVERELPQDLERARRELNRREEELSYAQSTESNQLHKTKTACSSYYQMSQGWMFAEGLAGATSTSQLLAMMSHTCKRPVLPVGRDGYLPPGYEKTYQQKTEEYTKCNNCDFEERALRRTNAATNKAQVVYSHAQVQLTTAQQELDKVKRELEQWQAKKPGLQSAKDEAEKAWLPNQKGCRATHSDYTTGLTSSVADCALNLYEPSCEKACLELQAGCGVMEGDRPTSASGKGGVEAPCAPPEPSWIQGPYTYGATEPSGGQCERIHKAQMWDPRMPRYSQKVLKTGWLWKKGHGMISSGWNKRFFVLESSNAVRSAVLRYYHANPSRMANLDESNGKGIILWDAKGIKSKNGEHYGWKNGEECFKILHFYRSYTFCVPRDSKAPSDRSVRHGETLNTRDEWMDLISDEITHPPRS